MEQLQRLGQFIRYVAKRFDRDHASSVAASLAYTSLLSLVPLLAIALGMLAAFPVFTPWHIQIENWIFVNFVPAVGQVVQEQVSSFIANAGRLSAAGIIGLGVTAIMLLVTIETSFNKIFLVDRHRSALSRLLVYWTIMTMGPLLVGAALSVQAAVLGFTDWQIHLAFTDSVARLLPTMASIAIFAVMYAAIPNRPIPPLDALTGGIVAGLLFALLRSLFTIYIARSDAYTTVYGAVAVVPIVLFWMFLSWVIVLIGAEITAALEEWRNGHATHAPAGAAERRLTLALAILSQLYQTSRSGGNGLSRRQLLQITSASEVELMALLHLMQQSHLVATESSGNILLTRDLSTLTLRDLVTRLDLELGLDERIMPTALWHQRTLPLLAQAHQSMDPALAITVLDLLKDQ